MFKLLPHQSPFLIIIIFLYTYAAAILANTANIFVDMQDISLTDAIYILAKFQRMNIILSHTINGTVTLHLHDATPMQAFNLLLASQGLATWQFGNTLYIAPHDELIKRKQEAIEQQKTTDASVPLVTQFWQIKYAKAEEIAQLLQDTHSSLLSKRASIHIDKRTNIICVQEVADKLPIVYGIIKKFDVPIQQIMIEARLAAVDSDFEHELGLNFSTQSLQQQQSSQHSSLKLPTYTTGMHSIAMTKLADTLLLDVKLAALEKNGHAELISSPSLFTSNQQAASIEAGEEVPYQEVSENGGTAITFKRAVLGLKVTPQVLPGNNILLQLQINQDRPSNKMVLGVPTINTRQIVTNVLVKTGQTIVLGGIYETNQENGQRRLPLISQLPLIGELFKEHHSRKNKRELLVFVTPKIVT